MKYEDFCIRRAHTALIFTLAKVSYNEYLNLELDGLLFCAVKLEYILRSFVVRICVAFVIRPFLVRHLLLQIPNIEKYFFPMWNFGNSWKYFRKNYHIVKMILPFNILKTKQQQISSLDFCSNEKSWCLITLLMNQCVWIIIFTLLFSKIGCCWCSCNAWCNWM